MRSHFDVIHITTAHGSRYNQRIYLKECLTTAKSGRKVALIVADGKGDETAQNITIYDIGRAKNRTQRLKNAFRKAYEKACELDAEIYHLHDPELLPLGRKLKRKGKKVIFDSHEDIPKQQLQRHDMGVITKNILSKVYSVYEKHALLKYDAVVAATVAIHEKFLKIHPNTIDINSYPDLKEFTFKNKDISERENNICYIGRITGLRGIVEMIQAVDNIKTDAHLYLGGVFNEPGLKERAMQCSGWGKVVELGWLERNEIHETLQNSSVGLVTIHPSPNHVESQPSKLFEYMAHGVPIVASNFPLWKKIVEGNGCGICVDPLNPLEIAEAIDYILSCDKVKKEMSVNGMKAAKEKFNWDTEAKKLIQLYDSLS